MKKTIELLKKQDDVLVDVIRYLDSHGHSDTPIREAVDKILNHSDTLHKGAELELKSHEIGRLTEC
tara:strand:+ start:111 stop:308 length:198 start_codon:yes stop_codon:yes gene_type:complete